jgi:predicted PurR-regulated permease PerM
MKRMVDTFGIIQRIVFFGLLFGVTILFFVILAEFAMPIFWALVFAVVLFPLFTYLRAKTQNSSLASFITILITLVLIFGPLSAIGNEVTGQAISMYQRLAEDPEVYTVALVQTPFVTDTLAFFNIEAEDIAERLVEGGRAGLAWIATEAFHIGTTTFTVVVKVIVMLYLLFFFLKDGERLALYVERLVPLGSRQERELFSRFSITTRSIVKGTVVVALVQGIIGGLLFWMAGIPNAVLWGTVMALLALIPALGPALVWLPAGIILLVMGNILGAVILLAGGGIIISLVDNVLRPILVGRDTNMPDPLILVAMLGGLATFGIGGLIIGPVIAAFCLSMWDIFGQEYHDELDVRG